MCMPPSRLDDKRVHSVLGLSTWGCLFHSRTNSHQSSSLGGGGPLALATHTHTPQHRRAHTHSEASEPRAEQREEKRWLQSQMPQHGCGSISNRMSKVSPLTWTSQYAELVQNWWQQKKTTPQTCMPTCLSFTCSKRFQLRTSYDPVFPAGEKNCT